MRRRNKIVVCLTFYVLIPHLPNLDPKINLLWFLLSYMKTFLREYDTHILSTYFLILATIS